MVKAAIDTAPNATKHELLAELTHYGMDTRRLEFLRWLVASGRDPEWDLTSLGQQPRAEKHSTSGPSHLGPRLRPHERAGRGGAIGNVQ